MRYILGFSLFFLTATAAAYDFSPQSVPQQSKAATRWSLAQWMEQKGKIQWMDLWLNSNVESPSFYEIYLGGDMGRWDREDVQNATPLSNVEDLESWRAHAGMFVSLLGVFGQYEKSSQDQRELWEAAGQLRLLGQSDQTSNLTAFYGLREERHNGDRWKNQFVGGYLNLYILDFWALQGKYQHFFKDTSDLGLEIEGHRLEATTWIEWGAVRLYGTWFREPLKQTNLINQTEITREGFYLGLRVYLDFKK